MSVRTVEILVVDSELAGGMRDPTRTAAQRDCVAPVIELRSGEWDSSSFESPDPGGFGLLVLSGFLTRRVGQRGRFGAELLGAGDLLRPWQTVGEAASVPFEPQWTVITDTRVAILGQAFAQQASEYPELASQLVGRALLRSRYLAVNMAIVHQPRIETRLHMLFWHLADRWGRMRPDGVALQLPLTHALLSDLVAARRPTVSTALAALAKNGTVKRVAGGWTLQGAPPAELAELGSGDVISAPDEDRSS